MDYQEYTKIGIIGPRTVMLDGHDFNNDMRISLRNKITHILQNLRRQNIKILGFTGLGLGAEQDFAIVCYENNIEYIGMLPFYKQENNWKNMPNVQKVYKELLESCNHSIVLEDGGYSPKKIFNKYKKIIEISDIIIVVESKQYNIPASIVEFLKEKTIVIINV